jgi:hypothetical protein
MSAFSHLMAAVASAGGILIPGHATHFLKA